MTALVLWFVVYTIAAFGFAYALGFSHISLPLRFWLGDLIGTSRIAVWTLRLVECPACVGWHIGFWGTWLAGWLNVQWLFGRGFFIALLAAFYTCGTNLLLARVMGLVETEDR